jgi:predicted transcriptional regulator
MPRSTVKLYLTRLEEANLIKKVQRSRAAVKTSNLYELILT